MRRRAASFVVSFVIGVGVALLPVATRIAPPFTFPHLLPMVATVVVVAAQGTPQVTMLNQAGEAITTLPDGALVRFSIAVDTPASGPTTFVLSLDDIDNRLVNCRMPRGATNCITRPVDTLGWYWEAGQIMPARTIQVTNIALSHTDPVAALEIQVQPRPVVLVHGFGSDYTTWLKYLGPAGFLARMGLSGFAVGDGQVPGTMYTGNLLNPATRTNTIAMNAATLGEYIANVKALTGAEQVDLVVHSMGGLIARYYIDRLMSTRDVAQLIMLGTPNGGSNCAVMVGSLGLYEPAGLELREDYVRNVFNPQITNARDIPFYNFAGTPIQESLLSPCSKVPNDLVVSLDSAAAAPVQLVEVPILHIDLTNSAELFTAQVAPLLRKSRLEFAEPGTQPSSYAETATDLVQYSQVFTGMVVSGVASTHTINIDSNVAVASFGLYDPSRTLTVTVRGASGNVIELSPATNGLTIVDDPEALLYLGYGFENPRPGPWQVTVHATPRTPPLGTVYAMVTQYVGGAVVDAALSTHLPGISDEVTLTAVLRVGGDAVSLASAQVVLNRPDGSHAFVPTTTPEDGTPGIVARFVPEQIGVYGIDITLRAVLPDGTIAERASYLALEAFAEAPEIRQ